MNPLHAYKQQQALGWTRVDMLLALYSGAIDRLEQALAALQRGEVEQAGPALLRAQRIVSELLAGIDMRYGELPDRLAQLYRFVLWAISVRATEQIAAAIAVLKTLREGIEGIQDQAVSLERMGQIPPVGAAPALSGSA